MMHVSRAPPSSAPLNQSSSMSAINTVKSRRSAATASRKKRAAMKKDVVPDDMKVLFVVENITDLVEGLTLKLQLLCPKKKPVSANLKRYIVRVVNTNTFVPAETPINSREMEQFSCELRAAFPGIEIEQIFKPTSDKWWKLYLRSVVTVNAGESEMTVRVSKRLIRNVVGKLIEERGLTPTELPMSPEPASVSPSPPAPTQVPSKTKWDFHTQEEEQSEPAPVQAQKKEETSSTSFQTESEPAPVQTKFTPQNHPENGYLEVRSVAFTDLTETGMPMLLYIRLV